MWNSHIWLIFNLFNNFSISTNTGPVIWIGAFLRIIISAVKNKKQKNIFSAQTDKLTFITFEGEKTKPVVTSVKEIKTHTEHDLMCILCFYSHTHPSSRP